MNLKSRLERLEKAIDTAPIILLMQDGSEYRIYPRGAKDDPIRRMLQQIGLGETSPDIEAVAHCTDSREPGGAHMVDLVKTYLDCYQTATEEEKQQRRVHFEHKKTNKRKEHERR